MSQQALFVITDDQTVLDACSGWMPPLKKERSKQRENPFTGKITTVQTLVPEEIDDPADSWEPTIEEIEAGPVRDAYDNLSKAEPISADFTLASGHYEIIKRSPPFLFGAVGSEVHEITRISPEHETEVLEQLSDLAGPWTEESKRREKGYAIFLYIYSY